MSNDPKRQTIEMLRVIRMDILNRARTGELDYERSIQTLEKHLGIAREIDNIRLLAQTYNAIGAVEMDRGHLQTAIETFRRALQEAEGHEIGYTLGALYGNLGEAHRRLADFPAALEQFALAQPIFETLKAENNGWCIGENNRGWVYLALREYETARTCFGHVLDSILMHVDAAASTLIETYCGMAEVELHEQHLDQAWFNANRAEEVTLNHGNHQQLPLVYLTQAHIAAMDGSQDPEDLHDKTREALRRYGKPPAMARFIFNEALYQQRHGNLADMRRLGDEARLLFTELGMEQEAELSAALSKRP